jgi:hypothetical protein
MNTRNLGPREIDVIRQFFIVLALTGGFTLAGPTPDVSSDVDLSGIYDCNGVGPEGDPYKGVVEIVRKDKTYWVQWTLSPQDINHGFGIIQGDMFAVTFFGGTAGIAIYKIEAGSRLVGQWTIVDANGGTYPETLTKSSSQVAQPQQPPKKTAPTRFHTVALANLFVR